MSGGNLDGNITDSLDNQLKEFSEKHGAVLLGMHRDLQAMQKSIDLADEKLGKADKQLDKAQTLSFGIDKKLQKQQEEILQFQSHLNNKLAVQLDAFNRMQSTRLAQLDKQQALAQALYEKALALLAEHKIREELFQLKVRRIGITVFFSLIFVAVAVWMR